jgi:hypothetical protein
VFPVRYELTPYVLFKRNSVFEGITLFREIIAVYCENHKNCIKSLRRKRAEFLNVNLGGTVEG